MNICIVCVLWIPEPCKVMPNAGGATGSKHQTADRKLLRVIDGHNALYIGPCHL
jgi:hypothetical protein